MRGNHIIMFGKKSVIGLDIGSRVVKVAELKRAGEVVTLEKFGIQDIYPNGRKEDAGGDKRRAQIEAIKETIARSKSKPKQTITAVRGESVITRNIQLPEMPEEELRNALQWEAEEYIPFHIEDVNLDSVILGHSPEGNKRDVLLICARKEIINDQIDIINEVGLIPFIIDVDSFAFLNCFEYNYQPSSEEVVALINIGADITSINIYFGGVSRFSRDISVAGDTITASIQSKLGLSFEEAEKLKISLGCPVEEGAGEEISGEETTEIFDTIKDTVEKLTGEDLGDDSSDATGRKVVKNTLNSLTVEIRRSLQFFENQINGRPVQKIVLGGGTAKMTNIDKYLSSELNLPTEIIDPLRRIKVTGNAIDRNLLGETKEMLGVVIGLALRKVVE